MIFRGLVPDDALAPFSLVVPSVEGERGPTVKLSGQPETKAMARSQIRPQQKTCLGVGLIRRAKSHRLTQHAKGAGGSHRGPPPSFFGGLFYGVFPQGAGDHWRSG